VNCGDFLRALTTNLWWWHT